MPAVPCATGPARRSHHNSDIGNFERANRRAPKWSSGPRHRSTCPQVSLRGALIVLRRLFRKNVSLTGLGVYRREYYPGARRLASNRRLGFGINPFREKATVGWHQTPHLLIERRPL